MSGVNGPCDRDCKLGRPHEIDCRNYIETNLPCGMCGGEHGRHNRGCMLAPAPYTDEALYGRKEGA